MSKPSIYMAGPIFGCTEGEAKNWREYVTNKLPWARCISPLRCEPLVAARYDLSYEDLSFGSPKSIVAKNFLDLRACDMTLAYFPKPSELEDFAALRAKMMQDRSSLSLADVETFDRIVRKSPQRSIGTIGEISWAYALRKPCVVVSDDPLILHHPFTSVQPDWPVLPDLDEAVRLIGGIFAAYAT